MESDRAGRWTGLPDTDDVAWMREYPDVGQRVSVEGQDVGVIPLSQ
jgi:hypothetical protein